MICGKITTILLCKVAKFFSGVCIVVVVGGGGGTNLTPPYKHPLNLRVFLLKFIFFNLGKFTNFKAFVFAVLMDTAKVVVMTT